MTRTCRHGYDLDHLTDSQAEAVVANCDALLIHNTLDEHAAEQERYWGSRGTSSTELAEICEAVPESVEVTEGLARPKKED